MRRRDSGMVSKRATKASGVMPVPEAGMQCAGVRPAETAEACSALTVLTAPVTTRIRRRVSGRIMATARLRGMS